MVDGLHRRRAVNPRSRDIKSDRDVSVAAGEVLMVCVTVDWLGPPPLLLLVQQPHPNIYTLKLCGYLLNVCLSLPFDCLNLHIPVDPHPSLQLGSLPLFSSSAE